MQNPNPFENDDNITTAEINFFKDPLYKSDARTFQPTPRQPNDIFLTCEIISNSIKAIKKNARKQLEQADELKDQLTQLKQLFSTQRQQPPMPRRINRNSVRSHPYLNEVSSHTSTIQSPTVLSNHHDDPTAAADSSSYLQWR